MKKYFHRLLPFFSHLQYASLLLSLGTLLVQIKFPFFTFEHTHISLSSSLWSLDFFSLHELFLLFFLTTQIKKLFTFKWYYYLPPLLFFFSACVHFFLWNDMFSLLKVRYFMEYWFFAVCIICSSTFIKIFWYFLLIGGGIESVICILQFFLQRPLGIALLYEAPFSPSMLGSAKILFQEHSLVRAYGTFEHPNITAFFLMGSLAATRMVPIQQKYTQIAVVSLLMLALLLTFSKTAFFTLMIFAALLVWKHNTLKKKSLLLGAIFFVACTIPVVFLLLANSMDTLTDRILYLQHSLHVSDMLSFLVGHGFGSSPFALLSEYSFHVMPWQLQPVHALLPLLVYEGGLIAASAGLLCLLPMVQMCFSHTHTHISTLLLCVSILIFSFTDHLLLTSHIGIFLLCYTSLLLLPHTETVLKKFFPFFER